MLSVKKGVKLNGLRPEMLFAVMVADRIYSENGIECVITSGTEGKHKEGHCTM